MASKKELSLEDVVKIIIAFQVATIVFLVASLWELGEIRSPVVDWGRVYKVRDVRKIFPVTYPSYRFVLELESGSRKTITVPRGSVIIDPRLKKGGIVWDKPGAPARWNPGKEELPPRGFEGTINHTVKEN